MAESPDHSPRKPGRRSEGHFSVVIPSTKAIEAWIEIADILLEEALGRRCCPAKPPRGEGAE